MEMYETAGREYPVLGHVASKLVGKVPLVDLRLMSDEEWSRLTRVNAVNNYTRTFGHPPESVEADERL